MKRWLFVACIAFFGMEAVANNKWGGMGAGLAEGLNMRIQIEQQRRQQELQAQQQRAAEERNRIMREEVRQREIEAQRQREEQSEDYRRYREREAAAAEQRAKEAEAQRQREAAEKERKYWDSRCTYCEGGKRCEVRATHDGGYCDAHYQVILEQQEAAKKQQEQYDAAMRNLKKCAATYSTGKACSNWANPGTRYCYKHQNFDPAHPIEVKALSAERLAAKDEDDTIAILDVIKLAIVDYVENYRKMPDSLKPLRMGRYRNRLRLTDVWGRAIVYEIVHDSYILYSVGADGIADTDDDLIIVEKIPISKAK